MGENEIVFERERELLSTKEASRFTFYYDENYDDVATAADFSKARM